MRLYYYIQEIMTLTYGINRESNTEGQLVYVTCGFNDAVSVSKWTS